MNPKGYIIAAVVVLLAGGAALLILWQPDPPAEQPKTATYDRGKRVVYSFNIRNTTSKLIEDAVFWTYAPVMQTSGQLCCSELTTSIDHTLELDTLGNQVVRIELGKLPPYASKTMNVSAQLKVSDLPNGLVDSDAERFRQAERFIESDEPAIVDLAKHLEQKDQLSTARAIYEYVKENLRDSGYTREDRGALYALSKRQGDCTEHAYLFVALARAAGIPARALAGWVAGGDSRLQASGFHNWAEFLVGDTWRIADPHARVFDDGYESYLATRIIHNGPEQVFKAHRFWFEGDGLKVVMR